MQSSVSKQAGKTQPSVSDGKFIVGILMKHECTGLSFCKGENRMLATQN